MRITGNIQCVKWMWRVTCCWVLARLYTIIDFPPRINSCTEWSIHSHKMLHLMIITLLNTDLFIRMRLPIDWDSVIRKSDCKERLLASLRQTRFTAGHKILYRIKYGEKIDYQIKLNRCQSVDSPGWEFLSASVSYKG